jgi:type I restriction enzyme S subunit
VNDDVGNGDLPEGWATRSVGQVLDARYGKALPQKARRGGPTAVYGSNGPVGTHDQAITSAPVIVLGRKGSVGAVNYSDEPVWPIDTTYFIDDFTAFEPRFLRDLLMSLGLDQMDRSTAIPGLSREQLYDRQVVIPPLAEQCRIADRLDEMNAHRASASKHLQAARSTLGRFRSAVLAAACSGRLTAHLRADEASANDGFPESWERTCIGELVGSIRGGSTEVPRTEPTPFPILRSSSVRQFSVDYDDVRYLTREQSQQPENFLAEQDLLVTRLSGSLEYVGNAARVSGLSERRLQYPDRLFRIRLKDPAQAEYVELFFGSLHARAQVTAATRSAAGHQRISISDLKRFEIALPPIDERSEVIRRTRTLITSAQSLTDRVAQIDGRLDRAARGTLAKAFRGDLVPTEAALADLEGRSYEDAEALLARIAPQRPPSSPRQRTRASAA